MARARPGSIRPRGPRRRLARAAGILSLLLALGAGRAAAAVGDMPPKLEPKEWVNGAGFEWKEKKGKVVLLMLVDPEVEAAAQKQAIGEAIRLDKDEAKNGLTVCLVSPASRQAIEAFCLKQKLALPRLLMALDDGGALRSYFATPLTPYLGLVDRDGKIAWEGAWKAKVDFVETLRQVLARPRTVPRLSTTPRFEPAWKGIESKDPKAAIAELLKIQAADDATPQEKDDAAALLDLLKLEGRTKLEAAKRLEKQDEYLDALDAYDDLADKYAGVEPGEQARAAAKTIRDDKKLKRELDACKTLREARELEAAGKAKEALEKYHLCASKWKGTKAADRAKKKADELEKAKKK
jgi:hypothetical protein